MSGVKGLDSFFDVLAVINNPIAYEQKVKELQEQTDKYKEVVEAVVELSKVNDYTVSIREREEKSKYALVAAEQLAQEKVANAITQANAIVEEKKEELRKAKETSAKNKEKEAKLAALEANLNDLSHKLEVAKKALEGREATILQKEKEVSERLAKLKSVMM